MHEKQHRKNGRLKRYICACHAAKIRPKFSNLHLDVIKTLEEDLTTAEKEKRIVVPLRQLSNDIAEQLPELINIVGRYRNVATDLYPRRDECIDISVKVKKLRRLWENADRNLAHMENFYLLGIPFPVAKIQSFIDFFIKLFRNSH